MSSPVPCRNCGGVPLVKYHGGATQGDECVTLEHHTSPKKCDRHEFEFAWSDEAGARIVERLTREWNAAQKATAAVNPHFDRVDGMHVRVLPLDELLPAYDEALPGCRDAEADAFLASIAGQVIRLRFLAGDAFEFDDGNHWLPDSIWTPEEVLHE